MRKAAAVFLYASVEHWEMYMYVHEDENTHMQTLPETRHGVTRRQKGKKEETKAQSKKDREREKHACVCMCVREGWLCVANICFLCYISCGGWSLLEMGDIKKSCCHWPCLVMLHACYCIPAIILSHLPATQNHHMYHDWRCMKIAQSS